MGGLFGLFSASMDSSDMYPNMENMTNRQKFVATVKTMGQRTFSMAKGLGVFSVFYSGIECLIEKVRCDSLFFLSFFLDKKAKHCSYEVAFKTEKRQNR